MTIKLRLTASFLLFFCLSGLSVGLAGLGLWRTTGTLDTLIHRDFGYQCARDQDFPEWYAHWSPRDSHEHVAHDAPSGPDASPSQEAWQGGSGRRARDVSA